MKPVMTLAAVALLASACAVKTERTVVARPGDTTTATVVTPTGSTTTTTTYYEPVSSTSTIRVVPR